MIEHKNYLFILANQGAGGHRLGRLISTIDIIYWYSDVKNGIRPNDVYFNPLGAKPSEKITGKDISPYHYDRLINEQMVPLLGERIEVYWHQKDLDYYYHQVWSKSMEKFKPILKNKILHWVLHDRPSSLLIRFPNAKIISLIDEDTDETCKRYMETTAKFPCYLGLSDIRPKYRTEHARQIDNIVKTNPNATIQDLWTYQNPNEDFYQFVKNKLFRDNNERKNTFHPRHLKLSWNDINLDKIEVFLKS